MAKRNHRRGRKNQHVCKNNPLLSLEPLEQRLMLDASWQDNVLGDINVNAGQVPPPYMDMLKYAETGNIVGFSIYDVAICPEGDIVVAGTASNYENNVDKGGFEKIVRPHSGMQDGFVAKFSHEGKALWISYIGGSEDDDAYYVDVDSSGNIMVAGSTYSYNDFPGYEDAPYGGSYMAQFTSEGTLMWTHSLGYYNGDGFGRNAYSLTTAPQWLQFNDSGGAYALGHVSESIEWVNNTYLCVASISSSGSFQETTRFSYDQNDLHSNYLAYVEVLSPTKVAAFAYSQTQNRTYELMILTPDHYTLTATIPGTILDTAVDAQGNIIATGYRGNPDQGQDEDAFVCKFNNSGQLQWDISFGGSYGERGAAVGADAQGNVYVSGISYSYKDYPFLNPLYDDFTYGYVFMAGITPDGKIAWNTGLDNGKGNGIGSPEGSGIDIDEDGIVFAYEDSSWEGDYEQLFAVCRIGLGVSDDAPSASLSTDFIHDDYTLVSEINKAGYLDIQFEDTKATSINGDELKFFGEGAENVSVKGKPKLIDKDDNIYRYTLSGTFEAGPVMVQYASGTFTNKDGVANVSASETFNAIPDLAPLQVNVDPGDFLWDDKEEEFTYAGDVAIGLKPAAGASFIPLVNIEDGDFSFDKERIYGEGVVWTNICGPALKLFEGDFEIRIGQSQTYLLEDNEVVLSNEMDIAGLDYQVTAMSLAAPNQLNLQGEINLPPEFGGFQLAVNGDKWITLSPSGTAVTGGTWTLSDAEIDLDYLEMKAESMSVEYIPATPAAGTTPAKPDALRFRGKVTLPDVFEATADFTKDELTGTDGYIEVSADGGVKWYGKLSVKEIVIVPDLWEVKEASLEVREGPGGEMVIQGDGKAVVPPGMEIICGLGFVNDEFNYIKLGVGDLNIPIGATGAYLQEIFGSINNMADPDATKIVFGGGVGFTAGPEIDVHLPEWAGGDLEGSLAEFGVEGGFNMSELTGTGTMKLVNGLVEGTAIAALNWEKGTLDAKCSAKALNNLITIGGTMKADSKMNINMTGTGAVTLPSIVPLWGGKQIAGGNSMLIFTNDHVYSNDFVAGWGTISISAFGKKRNFTAGIKVYFDGNYSFMGGKEVARTVQAATPSTAALSTMDMLVDPLTIQPKATNYSETATYTIDPDTEWIMINAQWDNSAAATVTLTAPDGTIYNSSDFVNSTKVALVPELSTAKNKVLLIDAPDAGQWKLTVQSGQTLQNLQFGGYQDTSVPELTIDEVNTNPYISTAAIEYSSIPPLDGYQVAFYYDNNNSGNDGVLIGIDDDGDGRMVWDTSAIAAGTYYVYATVLADGSIPDYVHYSQSVTIEAAPTSTDVAIGNGGAKKVAYTDNDGTTVTVTVKSDSGHLMFVGENISIADNRGNVTVSGNNLFLQAVVLDGTGDASITFTAKGGSDNQAAIGGISGGSAKSISGKGFFLTDDINLTGGLASMTWDHIDNDVTITAMASTNGFTGKFGNIGENVNFDFYDAVKSFSANQYDSGDLICHSLSKLSIKQGNFNANVYSLFGDIANLTSGGDITGDIYAFGSIKSVSTKADISGNVIADTGDIKIISANAVNGSTFYAGRISTISVKQGFDGIVLTGTGDLGTLKATGDIDLTARVAGSIKSISTKGDITGVIRAGNSIATVSVNTMANTLLNARNDIASVTVKGDLIDSWLLAGYDIGYDLLFSSDDTPSSGSINKVSVSGTFSGSSLLAGVLPAFDGTEYAPVARPWTGEYGAIGSVKFGQIDYTGDEMFGLFAATDIKPFKVGRDAAQPLYNFHMDIMG